jgi:hypothetical protein
MDPKKLITSITKARHLTLGKDCSIQFKCSQLIPRSSVITFFFPFSLSFVKWFLPMTFYNKKFERISCFFTSLLHARPFYRSSLYHPDSPRSHYKSLSIQLRPFLVTHQNIVLSAVSPNFHRIKTKYTRIKTVSIIKYIDKSKRF